MRMRRAIFGSAALLAVVFFASISTSQESVGAVFGEMLKEAIENARESGNATSNAELLEANASVVNSLAKVVRASDPDADQVQLESEFKDALSQANESYAAAIESFSEESSQNLTELSPDERNQLIRMGMLGIKSRADLASEIIGVAKKINERIGRILMEEGTRSDYETALVLSNTLNDLITVFYGFTVSLDNA